MASSSQPPSSSSTSIREYNFDVFLSFRGEDTRYNFTDHLFVNLGRMGMNTFRDDQLERGEEITSELLKAIEESRISIVVFSKNYAHSKWCLDELAKIMKCRKEKKQIVLPVFYHVDPSDVRKQTGSFGEAFSIHERNVDAKKVQTWRDSLTEASNLSGFHVNGGYESTHIGEITNKILEGLNPKLLHIDDNVVGIDSRLKEIKSLLRRHSNDVNDVHVVGIYGTGGIGKTTIAKKVYNEIQYQFNGASFLQDIREKSKNGCELKLQKQLLRDILGNREKISDINEGINMIKGRLGSKKILVVFDDVDRLQQLDSLAQSPKWFGRGSIIIITTRDQSLLAKYEVNNISYEVTCLNDEEALQLFCRHAFEQNVPEEDYVDFTKEMVLYAQGLPLALKVLGSSLRGMEKAKWASALTNLLKKNLQGEIIDVLRTSFDGLHPSEKEVFLDIACFFKRECIDFVSRILDDFTFCIRVLRSKCLVTISDNTIQMHDLIQQMGWAIVREKFPRLSGKWSRLWDPEDIDRVLSTNAGTKAIGGIILDLDMSQSKQIVFTTRAFKMMKNLRFLKVHQDAKYDVPFFYKAVTAPEVHVPRDFEFPSYELRYLNWDGYPLESLPSNFYGKNLVELKFRSSNIKQLFQKEKLLKELKVINLSDSQHLIEIPNISNAPKLEILILEGCKNLEHLPSDICELKYLTTLRCSHCTKLKIFPEIKEDMNNMRELHLDHTSIKVLPSSVERLKGLEYLDLSVCESLSSLPDSICNLRYLKTLSIRQCVKLKKLPENLKSLQCLEVFSAAGVSCQLPSLPGLHFIKELDVHHSNLRQGAILSDISCLSSLQRLNLSHCNLVEGEIPPEICRLSILKMLDLSGNRFRSLPAGISQLSKLRVLRLNHCKMLQEIPELPSSLQDIEAHDCACLETLSSPQSFPWKRQLWCSLFNCFKSAVQDLESWSICSAASFDYIFYDSKGISIVMPGSCGIPEWIRHQNRGSEVRIELPMNWHEDENLLGFVICSLYVPVKDELENASEEKSQSEPEDGFDDELQPHCFLECELSINGDQFRFMDLLILNSFCDCYRNGASGQVCLLYYPKIRIPVEYHSNQWRNLEVIFYFYINNKPVKVEKSGVRLIYG